MVFPIMQPTNLPKGATFPIVNQILIEISGNRDSPLGSHLTIYTRTPSCRNENYHFMGVLGLICILTTLLITHSGLIVQDFLK
jgi:hypothetical protein